MPPSVKNARNPERIFFPCSALNAAGIDKAVISAEDVTTRAGAAIVSNEEVKQLADRYPERLIGFASVDPKRKDALDVLEKAFTELNLAGLKLSPAMQRFMPGDPLLDPVYEMCIRYRKTILFEAGLTWVKDSPSKYSNPLVFEDVAIRHPELKMCLGHFGWPWTRETVMYLLVQTPLKLGAVRFYHGFATAAFGPVAMAAYVILEQHMPLFFARPDS